MSFDANKVDANITVVENKRTIKYEVTTLEAKKLRPISIIDDLAWILVYIPTKQTITDKNENATSILCNSPFFVTSDKKLINTKNDKLSKKYQLPEFTLNGNVRWDPIDLDKYRTTVEKIDIKNAFEQIRNHISKLIELKNPDYLNVFILWSVGTYFYKIFEYYPYLDFSGSKGSGKTKALSVLECLCYNANMSHRISGPFWARAVESQACTLLVDEQEDLSDPQSEHADNLRKLLHSAFRTDAQIDILVPLKGNSWTPKQFDISVPVALGHINPIHEVTFDRTIPMPMMKSSNRYIVDAEVNKEDWIWTVLRNFLYRMFLDYFDEVRQIKKEKLELNSVSSRERNQLWKPIIVLAKMFESHGIVGLVDSVLRVVEDTHNMRTVTNQSSNTDVQVLELLCEQLGITILPIGNKEGEIHWYSQQSIHSIARTIPGLEYLSSKELGTILGRLGFDKRKRNPHGMCVFITDEILKSLCQKYSLDFEALTAHESHSAQLDDKNA